MSQQSDTTYLSNWRSYLIATGSSEKSIKERTITLKAMLRRTGQTILSVTRQDLINDLARAGLAPTTRQNYKSLYHTFFTWIQDEGYRIDNPGARLPKVRVPHQEPNPVPTAAIERLLHSGIYRRTRMWVVLYAYQGYRAQEISAVSGESIDWDRRRILSKEGKNRKEVWRPLHPLVWSELQSWPRSGWLFPSPIREGEHVTANNVSRVLSDAMKRAGIAHRPHQLRAWYATELIDKGASTVVAAAAMRHSDVQSISKYALVSDRAIDEAQRRLPVVQIPSKSGRKAA